MNLHQPTSASVSVAMLAYNHGPYISKAIEGVLSQEANFPIELVIGEDHSNDNTLAIARTYEKQYAGRIRIITSDSNVGAKKNSRRLEAACTGKYIAYCEGDDYWHDPRKLQKQVEFLEANPDYSLVHTEFRKIFMATGKIIPNAARQPKNLRDDDAYEEILSGQRLILTVTACARRSELQRVLEECPECYDPQYRMGDTQRWLELARRGKVKCLHDVTATYVVLPESASQSRDPKKVLRFILSTKELMDHYLQKYKCRPATRQAAICRVAKGTLEWAFRAGDIETARHAYSEYRRNHRGFSFEQYLYFIGSHSPCRRALVHPLLSAVGFVSRVNRKLKYVVSGEL